MDKIIYKGGHRIPLEFIKTILKNLGCTIIKDNDYERGTFGKISVTENQNKLIPDLFCYLNGVECAVEVGDLNGGLDKVRKLLNFFDYVIHIFPEKHEYLMNCVLYEKKMLISHEMKKFLSDQQNIINKILKDSKEEEK